MAARVLVTGVSGFIAKHVALQLLNSGYHVRGTIRALDKAIKVKRALDEAGADVSRLSFAALDLTADEGWDEAAAGCEAIIHIASPFPLSQPRDRMALVPAAEGGALRMLHAAKKAQRIIVTSSAVAMMYKANRPAEYPFSESSWTDTDWRALSAYVVSKTMAEQTVWDTAVAGGFKHRVTTVNPGLVLGPPLDDDIGTSLDLVRMMMKGAYPAVPPAFLPVVDVRDVAELHVRAMENPETGGRRLLAAAETLSLRAVGEILKEAFPEYARKIPTRELPAALVRVLATFDANLAVVLPDLAVAPQPDTAYVTALTGQTFRPAREAIVAAGETLKRLNVI